MRRVEEYQIAYQRVLEQLEDEHRLTQRAEEQAEERLYHSSAPRREKRREILGSRLV